MMEIFRYLLVGLLNTGLGYIVIFGCMYLGGVSPEISNIIGYAVGLVTSYLLNRRFTFRSGGRRRAEFVRFVSAFLVAYMMNLAVLVILVRMFDVNAGFSQIIAGIVYVGSFYILNKYYVFQSILGKL